MCEIQITHNTDSDTEKCWFGRLLEKTSTKTLMATKNVGLHDVERVLTATHKRFKAP